MEASSVEQQTPPPSTEHSIIPNLSTEQQPQLEISTLPLQRDDGRPIELQDHHKETSSVMDIPPLHHHSEPSLIEDLHREPSMAEDTPSELCHSKPFEPSSAAKNLVDKPSPVQELQKETSIKQNLMEIPLEHHHSKAEDHHKEPSNEEAMPSEHPFVPSLQKKLAVDKVSPVLEHHKGSSIEKNPIEIPVEHHHTKSSPIQEHQKEPSMDVPPNQHHPQSAIAREPHKEPSQEKDRIHTPSEHHHTKPSVDAPKEDHNAKPSLAQDHHPTGKSCAESHQVESLTGVHRTTESHQTDPSRKAHQKDHLKESQIINSSITPHSPAEQPCVDVSMEGQPVTPQLQAVPLVVSLQHQVQNREDPFVVEDKTDPLVELSSQQQQINLIIEQQQVNLATGKKELTPLSKQLQTDSSSEKNVNVSLQHSIDVSTGQHMKPSSEPHHIEPPGDQQPYSDPSKEGYLESSAEDHQLESSVSQHVKHGTSSAFETPSIEVTDHTQSSKESTRLSEPTLSTEVYGNVTEEPTARESQIYISRPSQKPTRAEIDTAAPFESVKAAVSLFGERMDWKPQLRAPQFQVPIVERRILSESEQHKAQEDLVYHKDQLALTQASTAGVLLELKKVKKMIQKPSSKQEGTDILFHKSKEAADPSKHMGAASMDKPANVELQTILREVESVKEELISATVSKEIAVKGLQEALSSLNNVSKRVDELAREKAALDEAVADAHIALADAEEQVALLRSGHKVDSLDSVPRDIIEKKSAEIKGLELKLEEAKAMVMKAKEDLLASKEGESFADAAVMETQEKMAKVKLELEQAKSEELCMVGKLARILDESDEMKAKLEKATQEREALSSTVELLKANVEGSRMQLDSMHEKEQMACATLASLQEELHKVKEALWSAQAGEARALEAKDALPAAIKQAASEADEAKAAAEASKEVARKARQDIEQAKAATSTAMSRQQAALKELEAARASEAMALADLKALTESEAQGADMESSEAEGVMGVTISLEEYSALKQSAVEAEGLADRKVADVIAQVEEARASQLKAQAKLDEAVKEAEEGRDALHKAQKQADDAQEAKLTAEADLRKWRAEHDQRRKSGGVPPDLKAGTTQSSPRKMNSDEKVVKPISQERDVMLPPLAQGRKAAGRDSLAQVMSLHVSPAPERHDRVLLVENPTKGKEKVKKKNFIRRIASIVALKKP